MQDYLNLLEEAKKRDHRVVGEKLDLFTFSPLVGKGLPLWKPLGATLRDTLERWLRQTQLDNGYLPVVTPHIGNLNLYSTSGHYPYYKDSQYAPIQVDEEEFLLKPMNCPHHIMIYKSDMHSYRDLPVRLAEFGTVYRYEQSGELHGLTRVRGFTVDDAHMFVTPEQLVEEFKNVVRLIQYVFSTVGFADFRARVGVRDPKSEKYVGSDELWEKATSAILEACDELELPYKVEEGEAAFYGPKLDFIFRDVLKREWQLGTVQVDYNLPERFDLEYVAEDGSRQRPVMIHRAPFGSMERFIGILIEHFAGAFPVWLAPVQAILIPITDRNIEYAEGVANKLRAAGMRVEVDAGKSRMQAKIAANRERQIPYLLIVGDRDAAAGNVSVRLRTDEDLGAMPVDDFRQAGDGRHRREVAGREVTTCALVGAHAVRPYLCLEKGRLEMSQNQNALPNYDLVARKLDEIEAELKQMGMWQERALDPEQYDFKAAFGADTMSFPQWLQFIFLPNVRAIIAEQGTFPASSNLAVYAIREFDTYPQDNGHLLNLLMEFDALF